MIDIGVSSIDEDFLEIHFLMARKNERRLTITCEMERFVPRFIAG
ncbi:hypothetical protein AB6A23_09070 [Paenibacillus tarimensis]